MKKYLTFLLTYVFLLQIHAMHDDPDFDPQGAAIAHYTPIHESIKKMTDESHKDHLENTGKAYNPLTSLAKKDPIAFNEVLKLLNVEEIKNLKLTGKSVLSKIFPREIKLNADFLSSKISVYIRRFVGRRGMGSSDGFEHLVREFSIKFIGISPVDNFMKQYGLLARSQRIEEINVTKSLTRINEIQKKRYMPYVDTVVAHIENKHFKELKIL